MSTTLVEAVRTAKRNLNLAGSEVNNAVDEMVDLIILHIREVRPYRLRALKSALRHFDANKREWKR